MAAGEDKHVKTTGPPSWDLQIVRDMIFHDSPFAYARKQKAWQCGKPSIHTDTTIENAKTCIAALHQWRLHKIDIRIYVSLDTYQIVFTGWSRNKWEVPLRQQSKTLWHVLRISVTFGYVTNDGENSDPPHLTIHTIKQTQVCIRNQDTPKMTGKYKSCTHMTSE